LTQTLGRAMVEFDHMVSGTSGTWSQHTRTLRGMFYVTVLSFRISYIITVN
jgi:hypothetical protein